MFNNCNSETNGELLFFNSIKDNISIIFDVGARTNSEYINFNGVVHYFEPVDSYISELKKIKITAGKIMPPRAATLGSNICFMWVVSFLSCIPIRKKKGASTSLWEKNSKLIGVVNHYLVF